MLINDQTAEYYGLLLQHFKDFKTHKKNRAQIGKNIFTMTVLPLLILAVAVVVVWSLLHYLPPLQVAVILLAICFLPMYFLSLKGK